MSDSKTAKEPLKRQIVIVVLVALLIRILLLIFAYPSWQHGFLDADLAQNILEGHGIASTTMDAEGHRNYTPTAHDMPGYAVLLIFFRWLTGSESLIYIQIFQILIDGFLCGVIYSIAKHFFGKKIGLIAAGLFAIYLPQGYLSVSPMRDFWVSLGTTLGFLSLTKFLEKKRTAFLVGAGLAWGLASYFRPVTFLLPIFLSFLWLFIDRWRIALRSGIIMTLTSVLCLSPWIIRNYIQFDKFIPTRTAVFYSMWEGFGEFPNRFGAILNDEYTIKQMQDEGFQGLHTSPEFDAFVKEKVIKVIRENPLWYLGVVIKRIPYAFVFNKTPWGVGQDDHLSYHKFFRDNPNQKSLMTYSFHLARVNPGFFVTKALDIVILLSAIIGIYLSRRQGKKLIFLVAIPLYFALIHIPIHIEGRYMVPSHWVYLIFSGVTLNAIWEFIQRRRSNTVVLTYHEEILAK